MQKNRLRLKLGLFIVIITFVAVVLDNIMAYYQAATLFDIGGIAHYFKHAMSFVLINYTPYALLAFLVIYLFCSPIQRIHNKLIQNNQVSEAELQKAIKALNRLPKMVIFINLFGFLGGFAMNVILTEAYLTFSWHYLIFSSLLFIGLAVSLSYIQISFHDLLLSRTRELFEIHYVEDSRNIKPKRITKTHVIVMLFFVLYSVLSLFAFTYKFYFHEIKYTSILEQVIQNKITEEEARHQYKDLYIAMTNSMISQVQDYPIVFPMERTHWENKINDFFICFTQALLFMLLLVGLLSYSISKNTVKQIKMVNTKLKELLQGDADLTNNLSIIQFNEVGSLISHINRFIDKLRGILIKINDSSRDVSSWSKELDFSITNASMVLNEIIDSFAKVNESTQMQINEVNNADKTLKQMLSGIDDISNNVVLQNNKIIQTSDKINEMSLNLKEANEFSYQASQFTQQLGSISKKGNKSIVNVIEAISEIDGTATEVNEIITVISNIAEQTNLLAMNAAIEAAHAAEAGKGFAVVSDEIRKLAEVSSNSANEIISHIKIMNEKINNGVMLSHEAGKAFDTISNDIFETIMMIDKVTDIVNQQSMSMDTIQGAIHQVVESSESIKNLVDEERQNGTQINHSMQNVSSRADQIKESTNQQMKNNHQIAELIDKVKDISRKNMQMVHSLTSILEQFKLEQAQSISITEQIKITMA